MLPDPRRSIIAFTQAKAARFDAAEKADLNGKPWSPAAIMRAHASDIAAMLDIEEATRPEPKEWR